MLKGKSYTFFIASTPGKLRKVIVPAYVLHVIATLALIGSITVVAAIGSYSRMLWKVGNYNALRHEEQTLRKQYQQLQSTVNNTNQRLDSLQSLATEVAMTYGFMRFRQSPFGVDQASIGAGNDYEHSIEQFNFLQNNVSSANMPVKGLTLVSTGGLGDLSSTPSLWPVIGHLTDGFGERMDPFSGEGAFHTGVDIASQYGDSVRATADGVVLEAGERAGYGRLVVIDHGYGLTTWYGHLSTLNVLPGEQLHRGDTVGNVGVSGRSTGPHVHYEVRINGAPVNPMRYLRQASAAD